MKADIKLDDTRVFIEGDRVGVGVSDPQFLVEVGDRMRVRQGASLSAGIWFQQNNAAAHQAFVGMENDHSVGFWAGGGAGWGVVMDTKDGDLKVKGEIRAQGAAVKSLKAEEASAQTVSSKTVTAERVVTNSLVISQLVTLPGLPGMGGVRLPVEEDLLEIIKQLRARVDSLEAEVQALKKKK